MTHKRRRLSAPVCDARRISALCGGLTMLWMESEALCTASCVCSMITVSFESLQG
jgi:hypothetical protein